MRGLGLFLVAAALVSTGCGRHYSDTSLYQISGRQKPVVAVLPVINHTAATDLPWDLSRELTDEMRKRVYDSKRIYLLREGASLEVAQLLSTPNPQAISRAAIDSLGKADYALVTEIVEQEQAPARPGVDAASLLSLGLRVRVIDLRKETPRVILQEVLDKDFVVARAYMNCDYNKMGWGTEAFSRTPMGMAHSRLVRELIARVEAYIEVTQ